MWLANYAQQYPYFEQLTFATCDGAPELCFLNAFGFSTRHRICALGYRQTLDDRRAGAAELAPLLGAHGIRLRTERLAHVDSPLLDGLPPRRTRRNHGTPAPRA